MLDNLNQQLDDHAEGALEQLSTKGVSWYPAVGDDGRNPGDTTARFGELCQLTYGELSTLCAANPKAPASPTVSS